MWFWSCFLVPVLTFVLTPTVIALSWKIGAVDVPTDYRRMHPESIPRAGGLAIFASFAVGCLLMGNITPFRIATLCGGGILLMIGLLDDVVCLGAWTKLFFQIAASAAVLSSGTAAGWQAVFAVFWVVLLINAHNLIDGIDGLLSGCAGLEGVMLAVTLLLVGGMRENVLPPLLLSLSCLAFRLYNRYPAQIFAGDCGSESVGFLFGMLSLPLFGSAGESIGVLSPLLLFAYPVTELISSVLRRILRGRSPFSADRAHLHHRLNAAGLSVPECCGVLLCVAAGVGIIGVMISVEPLRVFAPLNCLLAVVILVRARRYVKKSRLP